MASSLTRFRLHYLGSVRISRLAAVLVFLGCVYAAWRYSRTPSRGVVRYKPEEFVTRMPSNEIAEYLEALQDTRPERCPRQRQLKDSGHRSVSLILSFHGEDVYRLKLTLSAILHHTPMDLIHEIVVLDDGTANFHIRKHAADFLGDEMFRGKVRAFRSDTQHGPSGTRFKGSKVARGDILVFVDNNVVVNYGWLEPLIIGLRGHENRFVVPHSDNFLSEKRFFGMDDDLVSTYSWRFGTFYKKTKYDKTDNYLLTPVMRGDVVAVRRSYLSSLGDYDEHISIGGGENLELSLRAWMCGGEIVTAVCSRIATHNALEPHEVSNPEVVRRITELWMGHSHQDLVFRQTNNEGQFTSEERQSIKTRKTHMKSILVCKSFDWYLNTVASDTQIPSELVIKYGKLKSDSGYCPIQDSDEVLSMQQCRPYMYSQNMMFEYTKKGNMRRGNRCLIATELGTRVVLGECSMDSVFQIWRYVSGHYVMDVIPGSCLTHVTDMDDRQRYSHYLTLDRCKEPGYTKQLWSFLPY